MDGTDRTPFLDPQYSFIGPPISPYSLTSVYSLKKMGRIKNFCCGKNFSNMSHYLDQLLTLDPGPSYLIWQTFTKLYTTGKTLC